ncbi:uncharacterized protein LOC107798145 [Nicotiana tabacum]|uniref:Uncharacterized protein LOC107798145 n=1 Tax=Nicotiana tabacum TaxID=4097 RepID=A0A1S4AIS0_TOBAC|nr:PREDICTED: uncharacterized protein LOC107798145 [Nicotiana tabacum]
MTWYQSPGSSSTSFDFLLRFLMTNPTEETPSASIVIARNTLVSDASDPLYLLPSDSPGMVLVNLVFDGKIYGGWRKAIVIALSAKNKLGFIDGSIKEPDLADPSSKAWNRCNDMVISLLLNSLSRDIADSVLYSKTAKDIWMELEARFGQCNGAQLYQLQKELNELVQGNTNIAGYYTKMKKIWDELDTLNICITCSCNYSCGGKEKTLKSFQDGRLIQFLMGLNEAYGPVKSNFLMMTPLPNGNQDYSLLIQDEKQREIHIGMHPAESTFMEGQQQVNNHKTIEGKFKGNFAGKRNNLFCNYFKKPGHTIDKCYRIVDFPADLKFTKSKKFQNYAHGNATITEENAGYSLKGGEGVSSANTISQEQYNQLFQMLQQMQIGQKVIMFLR